MLMKIALNAEQQIVHIDQVQRGLACNCTCFECGETVIAKQGDVKEHHFAHVSNKESCDIQTESILHKYAKQVIEQEQKLYLPSLSNANEITAELWQFKRVMVEQNLGAIRPDLVATYNHDELLFIEIAVTSFIDEHKAKLIEQLGIKTVEINLNMLLKNDLTIPSDEVKNFILNNIENKTWIYPKVKNSFNVCSVENQNLAENGEFDKGFDYYRFTINHSWVEVRFFKSGMLSVKTYGFNHDLKELFKQWRNEGGGKYDNKYKSWNYWLPFSQTVFQRLQDLDMTPKI